MNTKSYTALFCEENIWHLVKSINTELLGNYTVLFLTNKSKKIALMNQKAAAEKSHVIWDYHVILHEINEGYIFDYDSSLGFKTPINSYFSKTFGNQQQLLEEFRTGIIAIPASEYKNEFHSDRSHMLNSDGNSLCSFPSWPKIDNKGEIPLKSLMNLDGDITRKYPLTATDAYLKATT